MNVVDQIPGIEKAVRATVTLMPPDWAFRIAVTEAKLRAMGCPYETNDPARIGDLLDLLRRADLSVVTPSEPTWMNETREGVFLELPKKSRIHFLFTINFRNIGVRGYFYHPPTGRETYITVKSSLVDELVLWADRTGASIPKDVKPPNDQRMQKACSYFAEVAEKLK